MRFLTDAHKQASEAQRRIAELEREKIQAAEAGDTARLVQLRQEIDGQIGMLAHARNLPALVECRHCHEEFEPVEYIEVVVSAIVHHRLPPQEDNDSIGTTSEIFPRGEELHLVYCPWCEKNSGILEYLGKR